MTMRNPNQRRTLKAQAPLLRPQKLWKRHVEGWLLHHCIIRDTVVFPAALPRVHDRTGLASLA